MDAQRGNNTDVDGLINPNEDQLVSYVLLLGNVAKYRFNG